MPKKINLKVNLDAKKLKEKMGLKDGINGKDGVNGKDAIVDTDKLAIEASTIAIESIKPLIPTIEQLGEKIPVLGEPIRDSLELLEGDNRLDAKAIKGLDKFIKEGKDVTYNKALGLYQLVDVSVAGITANQSIKWDGQKWVAYTPTSSTPSLQQVTDVGATTTNVIDTAGYKVNGVSISDIYVPYTGANADVDLGSNDFRTGTHITVGYATKTTITAPVSATAYGTTNLTTGYTRGGYTYNYRIYSYANLFNQTYYSPTYQTVSFTDTYGTLDTPGNCTVALVSGTGYPASSYTYLNQYIYAYKIVDGVKYYSSGSGYFNSYDYASTDYDVQYNWDAVAGADGYLITGTKVDGFFHRFVTTNSLLDDNTGWTEGENMPTNLLGDYLESNITWSAVAGAEGYVVLVDTTESPGFTKRATTLTNSITDSKFTLTTPDVSLAYAYSDTSYIYGKLRTNQIDYYGTPSLMGDGINYVSFSGSGISIGYDTKVWDTTTNIGYNNLKLATLANAPINTTVIGVGILENLTGLAQESTVIGYKAANQAITDYNYNITLGSMANYYGNGASYGINIGYMAGYASTNDYNTFIGPFTGPQVGLSTAYANVAIGRMALSSATSAQYNMVIGDYAGSKILNGQSNTLVGLNTGANLISGSNNTCIGNNSGYGITTAGGCTYIGGLAGYQAFCDNDPYASNSKLFYGGNITYTAAFGENSICHKYQGFVIGRPRGNSYSGNTGDSYFGVNIPYPMYQSTINGTQMIVDTLSQSSTEQISNGSFNANATNWTLGTGWAWSSTGGWNNQGSIKKSASSTGTLVQAIASMAVAPVVGNIYVLNFGVYNMTAGYFGVSFLGENCTSQSGSEINANGRYQIVVRCTSATAPLTFTPSFASTFNLDDISIRQVTGGDLILGNDFYIQDAGNIILGSATGTRIGTSTTQKLGFYNATPIVQPANTVAINDTLVNLGLRANGGESNFSTRVTQQGTFAEIYVADASATQSIPNGTTYTKLTAFTTNGSALNCTADATNDKITITKAGKYLVTATVSGYDGATGAEFKMALFYDGAEKNNIHVTNKFNAGSEIDCMTMNGILVAVANKDIDIRLRHDGVGFVNFTTQYANLTITYIGE